MTNMIGARLGEFELVRELGRGGMGVVYEAIQGSLNRRVALKVLGPGLGLTPRAVDRFHREAAAAAKLHHTNIVPIHATGEANGFHYYAMELIDGPSLDRVVAQFREQRTGTAPTATLPPTLAVTGPYVDATALTPSGSGSASGLSSGGAYFDAVARIVADVADALHHAHYHGVIHRDIKPSNLLLSPEGRLCLTDFGLARVLEQPGMTVTGEFVGTPAYMSPEQITAGRIPVDHRTDIYSLGATLYELLTLRPPFVGDRRDQILAQVVQKEPAAPRKLNPQVPRDLETICLKCLEKDPDRRYPTAKELADDLRRYLNRFAILARRAGPLTRAAKWVKRNPTLAAALAAVLVCAAVAGGLAYRSHLREREHEKELAALEQERLEEKRRSTLERAILAARLEDFEGANEAIREAEKLGCSAGQVRMLLGQLELYRGHGEEAMAHLRQAVELLPESVAAWSMLAVVCSNAGNVTEAQKALTQATRLTPRTPEDYLFLGHAETTLDPERGLKTLDEAVRRRPSVLARLVRIDALQGNVLESHDPDKARLVAEEVRWVKQQAPENAMLLYLSIKTHLTCYHAFGEAGLPAQRQMALDEGWKDMHALERYRHLPTAVLGRWFFLDGIGRADDAALAELSRVGETSADVNVAYNLGSALYRRGQFARAVAALERCKGEVVVDLMRVIVLAELPDGVARANKLCDEILARNPGDWNLFNTQLILRFLGRKPQAVDICGEFLRQPERFPPLRQEQFRRTLEYCVGQRSAEDLIASMQGARGDLCNVHLTIALTALADGDRDEARKHLQLCLGTHYFEFVPYELSLMLLWRMEKDATWPPWIPPQKK